MNIEDPDSNFNRDTIVFLRCHEELLLAKSYPDPETKDGWRSYDCAVYFDFGTVPVGDLDQLHYWLQQAVHDPHLCAVRGELIDGPRVKGARRLIHDKPDAKATLRDVPRWWLPLDLDSLDLPAGVDPLDLVACMRAIEPQLPEVFRGARCIVQATAGHSIKPGARLRPWYWLDRPITTAEAKRWLKQVKARVDLGLYNPSQPIYTAAPVFLDGRSDPMPSRLALIDGAPAVVVPPIQALAPREPGTSTGPVALTTARLEGIIRSIAARKEGDRNFWLHWGACRLGEAIKRKEIRITAALSLLMKTALHVGLSKEEAEPSIWSGLLRGEADFGSAREFNCHE
jgi:hypothetical protein